MNLAKMQQIWNRRQIAQYQFKAVIIKSSVKEPSLLPCPGIHNLAVLLYLEMFVTKFLMLRS